MSNCCRITHGNRMLSVTVDQNLSHIASCAHVLPSMQTWAFNMLQKVDRMTRVYWAPLAQMEFAG